MKYQILRLLECGKWIPYNQVIYYEEGFRKKINQNILAQYPQIRDNAIENRVLFFYLPRLNEELKTASEQFAKTINYNHPEWSQTQIYDWIADFQHFIQNISIDKFYDTIGWSAFTYQAQDPVHLIRRLDADRIVVWDYASFIDEHKEISIPKECFYSSFYFNSEFLYKRRHDDIEDLNDLPDAPSLYDVDDRFKYDADKLSGEIREKMALLSKEGLYGNLIETLLFAVSDCVLEIKGSCTPYNLTLEQRDIYLKTRDKLAISYLDLDKKILNFDSKPFLSSLLIDNEFRIWLPEFNNVEIILKPLPKALFILFLKHPEGILLKHLADYKEELIVIYSKISNRTEKIEMGKSIDSMINPTNNSTNEKCSRIKEAFIKEMDNSLAKNYYITGERGRPKTISLDPSKVTLPF